ncbi:MAG TPA: T9SS type A sorting domain-containing protein [Flavobacteriales bacterium]|jgi:hypothetical protein|nr:T9SS type A sorting domain-containing protein [Flavobacteriales bacterium]
MRISTALLSALLFSAAQAQETVTVTTTPGYAEQLWYSLADGPQGHAAANQWDLAFEINGGFTVSVQVNTAIGERVFQSPYTVAQWAQVDTLGMAAGWPALIGSDTSWSYGALNQNISGEFDLGWGSYNMATHVVVGDSVFVLQLANGDWKKLRIDALATGVYTFTYSALDGSSEHTGTIAKADYTGKNFAYWNMSTNAVIDREPQTGSWDLLFTKYTTLLGPGMPYGVTGALQNKGVSVAQVNDLPPAEATHEGQTYASAINTIGYDWKYFDMTNMVYVIDDSLTYFVKDLPGNLWKVVFTEFGGGATGDITFTKELISAVGIDEPAPAGQVVLYPNPVENGQVQLVLDVPATQADVAVFDLTGKQVAGARFGSITPLAVRTLDVSTLAPGTYAVRVQHAQGQLVSKLVVR